MTNHDRIERLLVVADARSTHLDGWMPHLLEIADEVVLASTYAVSEGPGVLDFDIVELPSVWAWLESRRSRSAATTRASAPNDRRRFVQEALDRGRIVDSYVASNRLKKLIASFQPTVVHAMRSNFEGITALKSTKRATSPLVVSIWGQDLVRDARRSRPIDRKIRSLLKNVDGLHADCQRDARLAESMGLRELAPTLVAPSAGGVSISEPIRGLARSQRLHDLLGVDVPAGTPIILNVRGIRSHVVTDTFLNAVLELSHELDFVAIGLGLARHSQSEEAAAASRGQLLLTESIPHDVTLELLRCSDVSVSPSTSDGTPNSLLESMASGAVPIASPLDSVLEWVQHERTALLHDPFDAHAFAGAIRFALSDHDWADRARAANFERVAVSASMSACRESMADLYRAAIEYAG